MIEIATGQVGSGKSYFSVVRIIEALLSGRPVITNVSIKPRELAWYLSGRKLLYKYLWSDERWREYRYGEAKRYMSLIRVLDDDEVTTFWKYGQCNAFIVLDELHLYFSNRDWSKAPKDMVRYLSQHRKGHDDLFMISQNVNLIDITYRRLASRFWHVHNPRGVPLYRFLPIPLPESFIVHMFYGENQRVVQTRLLLPNKEIFAIYDTFKTYTSYDIDDDTRVDINHGGMVAHEHFSESKLGY